MHERLVDEIVKVCRQRLAEGDCPTVEAPARETLENAVIALADQRDAILPTLTTAMSKTWPNLMAFVAWDWRRLTDENRPLSAKERADLDAMLAIMRGPPA